jgi:hypothetical protein
MPNTDPASAEALPEYTLPPGHPLFGSVLSAYDALDIAHRAVDCVIMAACELDDQHGLAITTVLHLVTARIEEAQDFLHECRAYRMREEEVVTDV